MDTKTIYPGWGDDLGELLVGNSIEKADKNRLTLSNGTVLEISESASDCCSWLDLIGVNKASGIITAVYLEDDEEDPSRENDWSSDYKAWIRVLTDADPAGVNIAEAEGNFSNGYYLHGFALPIVVHTP